MRPVCGFAWWARFNGGWRSVPMASRGKENVNSLTSRSSRPRSRTPAWVLVGSVEPRPARTVSGVDRHRRSRRSGQSPGPVVARRGVPTLLGAQVCATWKTNSRPHSPLVWTRPNSSTAPHRTEALHRFRVWKKRWQQEAPKAVACLEQDLEELLAFFDCPSAHWKRVRTTNVIERLFVEVRRRIRTMYVFTTRSSCNHILYSVFDRMNTYWDLHSLKPFTQKS